MNLQVTIPKNWNYGCGFSFSNWFKNHIKSPLEIEEDYTFLNYSLTNKNN